MGAADVFSLSMSAQLRRELIDAADIVWKMHSSLSEERGGMPADLPALSQAFEERAKIIRGIVARWELAIQEFRGDAK